MGRLELNIEFELDSIIYLKTDSEQLERIVTAVTIRTGGYVIYELSNGETCSWHVSSEISITKDILKKILEG